MNLILRAMIKSDDNLLVSILYYANFPPQIWSVTQYLTVIFVLFLVVFIAGVYCECIGWIWREVDHSSMCVMFTVDWYVSAVPLYSLKSSNRSSSFHSYSVIFFCRTGLGYLWWKTGIILTDFMQVFMFCIEGIIKKQWSRCCNFYRFIFPCL